MTHLTMVGSNLGSLGPDLVFGGGDQNHHEDHGGRTTNSGINGPSRMNLRPL
jgi:hypothetical protein